MIHTVLLCDKNWKILEILYEEHDMRFAAGSCVTDLVSEPAVLAETEEQNTVSVFFPHSKRKCSAVIRAFPQKYLLVLADITGNTDFIHFMNTYQRCVSWAEDHINGLYHNEYYQIQQINNQLIDAQRALARSNRKLKQAFRELEHANEELEHARQTAVEAMALAEHANQSKSVFLANMSHDIRTPMNTILGIAHLIEHDLNEPEKLRGYVKKLSAAGQHLLGLINDILDINKIESGSVTLREDAVNLTEQIEQIETIIRPQAQSRNQTFEIHAENVQHRNFIGDATRLRQVLLNILSNAVKYTQTGGTITFDIIEQPTDEAESAAYLFVITDNGAGMTPEFQKILFHSFTRAENTSEMQGTGLGMAITKAIVDLMGGKIIVRSAPGKGSRFEVTAVFRQDLSVCCEKDTDIQHKADETQPVLAGMRLLCAEDNALNAEILGAMLDLSGATYTICSDGQQIVQTFERTKPGDYDAILMDVQMPHMNGYEATKAIRSGRNPLGRTIPIIAMTANAFSDDIQRSLDSGMDAHISKPIDINMVEQTMREFYVPNQAEPVQRFSRKKLP